MSLKPIPLTTDPSDKDSPKGAIPVDLYGVGDVDLSSILSRLEDLEDRVEELEKETE